MLNMFDEGNAVQLLKAELNGMQTVGDDSWRLLLEMFLNSQDICKQSLRAIGLDSHEYSAHSLSALNEKSFGNVLHHCSTSRSI